MRLAAGAVLAPLLLSSLLCTSRARADDDAWFGGDKALHFAIASGLGGGGYAIGVAAFEERWAGVAFGAGLGLVLSGAKEAADAAGLGTPSYKDFIWSMVGTALGVGVAITFDAALRGPLD
jgi:putative lipoprotein